ncbi:MULTISPECIES: hypothetical protein [Ferrimonas]|uniref:hypothetical protein n=1 Tax=Ferrimonas TaxID=44011 RepID=UPI0012EBFF57|nr:MULTISPECIES: hypothetical protein [Ferrimonas]USD35834.1 hypothetical protein J8Z22_12345 [Ferrimonas sp. SCSIO 43195]
MAFILLAALLFDVLDSSTLAVMSIEAKEEAVAKELKEVKSNLAIWTYIGPAAIAAIGVNLISEFL